MRERRTEKDKIRRDVLSAVSEIPDATIEELKTAAQNPSSKSRHRYYILKKIFYNGSHLIKKRKGVDESPGVKYANIAKEALELFKSYCITCQAKKKRNKTAGVVVKPLLSSELNSPCQVDLLNMQLLLQAQFKWIMVYQCHLTKFVILLALTSERADEVAFQLLDIFPLFGAPAILQRNNGSKVIPELKELWPQLILVHGKPRHPGFSRTSQW
ncbi:KRAB-A domain-containing protein 2-like [Penaeus chinensis]|uniref:KRAB-A domain-containing protein 2-like n=1 Tax=Penaeus chinensis TaxID=139456 RepID=UPI001FB6F98A|nr:KRAB-A domain-containing protein 2-like [Penaeus chinensis]